MLRPGEQVEFDGKLVYPKGGHEDLREDFREWFRFFRHAAMRNVLLEPYGPDGLDGPLITDKQARTAVKSLREGAEDSITLLGGINHLRVVENFWLNHTVDGQDLLTQDEVYGNEFNPAGLTLARAVSLYREQGKASDRIIMRHDLGERFISNVYSGDGSPQELTFLQILLHVQGELSRHTGQLDVVRQHITGFAGE